MLPIRGQNCRLVEKELPIRSQNCRLTKKELPIDNERTAIYIALAF